MSCFIYFGHFYRQNIDLEEYSCRSTLEIVSLRDQTLAGEALQNPGALLDNQQPDAVIVMLNPGSSRPCDDQAPSNCISPSDINPDARSNLILTRPDPTQRKIEKVMACLQLNHVRVLNLFDIREPESKKLIDRVRESLDLGSGRHLDEDPEIKPYSIFSDERSSEFTSRFNATNRIVIAWGREARAKNFYRKCYCRLSDLGIPIIGWQREGPNDDRTYYHPGRKDGWSRYIINNWPDEPDAPDQG